jgi:hypothetical protein
MPTVEDADLWKCKQSIAVKKANIFKNDDKRKVLIEVGEIIEFRYYHSIHFRTTDDIYCVLDEKTFYENFEPYGKIFGDVRFSNKCKLQDILEHDLFKKWEFIKKLGQIKCQK